MKRFSMLLEEGDFFLSTEVTEDRGSDDDEERSELFSLRTAVFIDLLVCINVCQSESIVIRRIVNDQCNTEERKRNLIFFFCFLKMMT